MMVLIGFRPHVQLVPRQRMRRTRGRPLVMVCSEAKARHPPRMVLPVLSALSDAAGAPVHEQDDGAIRLERPTLNRQPLLPTPRTAEPAPEVPEFTYLAEVALSSGADQPVPRLSLTGQVLPATPSSWSCLPGAPYPYPYPYAGTHTGDEVSSFHVRRKRARASASLTGSARSRGWRSTAATSSYDRDGASPQGRRTGQNPRGCGRATRSTEWGHQRGT